MVVDERVKAIEKKKVELKELEKNLREREKFLSKKRMIEIGKLAEKAKIDGIEPEVLYGAFLDIANSLHNEETVRKWKGLSSQSKKKEGDPIAVSFKNSPSVEAKDALKKLHFRWNKFRHEFCGFGEKSIVDGLLNNFDCTIEVIE